MKIQIKEEVLVLRYFVIAFVFLVLGYFLTVYIVSNDCIDKGYTNIGKGFHCSLRYGDNIEVEK